MLNKALQRQITCEEAQAAMTEIDLIFDDDLAQYVHLKLTVCSRYAFDLKRARLGWQSQIHHLRWAMVSRDWPRVVMDTRSPSRRACSELKLGGVSAAELRRNSLRRASRVRCMLLTWNKYKVLVVEIVWHPIVAFRWPSTCGESDPSCDILYPWSMSRCRFSLFRIYNFLKWDWRILENKNQVPAEPHKRQADLLPVESRWGQLYK